MTRRPIALLVALVVAASTLAACTSDDTSDDVLGPTTTAVPATTAPPAPGTVECSNDGPIPAVASYRPDRPLSVLRESEGLREIRERERLVVGVSADTLLFGARNPFTNHIEGFDIDILREVALAIFGDRDAIEFRVITYAQRLPALEDGTVDLVAHTMTINCTRWQRIAFSSEYYPAGQRILLRDDPSADEPDIQVEDLDGERICAAEGSTNIEKMADYPYVETIGVPDLTDCLVLFQQGAVDGITGDDTVLAGFRAQDPYARVTGRKFTAEPYGVGANSANVDLVMFVNSVLEQLRANGRWQELANDWVGSDAPQTPPPAVYGR